MILRIRRFRYLGRIPAAFPTLEASVEVTEIVGLRRTTSQRSIYASEQTKKWFWHDTNKPCPMVVDLLASDFFEENPQLKEVVYGTLCVGR